MNEQEKLNELAKQTAALTQKRITTMIAEVLHARAATFELVYDALRLTPTERDDLKELQQVLKNLQLSETVMMLALGMAAWKDAISLDAVLANMIEHGVDKDKAEKCVSQVRVIAENLRLEQPYAKEVLEKFTSPTALR